MLIKDWDRLAEADRVRALESLVSSTSRLRALVDDVLDLTRIEAGKLQYELGVVELVDELRRAAEDVDPVARRVVVTAPDEGVRVRGDAGRIWQIATNLMSNALKFSPQDAPVEVVVEREGGSARVAVTDHGGGISPEELPTLFQPFSRLAGSVGAGRHAGMGLGLYIAGSLVRDQGGDIGVRSELGAGSTFHFTLPLCGERPLRR